MLNPENMLKKYQKMIYSEAWKYAKRWGMDFDDVTAQGYFVFMDAITRFEEGKETQFGTFLYYRLMTLNDYCIREKKLHGRAVQMLIDEYKNNPQKFTSRSLILENSCYLTYDAKEILQYLLSGEWETPGSSKLPSQNGVRKVFQTKGWQCQRFWDAWEDLKNWYQDRFGVKKELIEQAKPLTYDDLVLELLADIKTTDCLKIS